MGLAVRAVVVSVMVTMVLVFLLRLGTQWSTRPFLYSRAVLLMTWSFFFIWLVAGRVLFGRALCRLFRQGLFRRRIAVAGASTRAQHVADRLRGEGWMGYEVVGHLTNTREPKIQGEILGSLDALPHLLSELDLDEIWLALPNDEYQTTLNIVVAHYDRPVVWRMTPRHFEELVNRVRVEETEKRIQVHDELLRIHRAIRRDLDLPEARVAFVGSRGIPATWGGVEQYVEAISTRLVARGYQATVYCRPYYMTTQEPFHGVRLRALPTIPTKHLDAIVHTALATAHVILQDDDIVHYQAIGPSLLSLIPRFFGKHTVVTVQGLDWQRAKWGRLARRFLQLGEWASATFPNQTIVVSEALQQHYHQRYGRAAIFIPNGAEPPNRRPPKAIRAWGLEKDGYVLFVGRLVPEKGCHYLVEAFRRVETNKKLVIAGGTSHSDDYVARLQNMRGAERVVFTGYVYDDTLAELYTNAYLYVLPSEIEGRAITLLEALSYGNCVLVSDIPENVEVVQACAHTFHSGDVDDLARQLQRLLDDPVLVETSRKQVQARMATRISWDWVVDETEAVYRSLY
jgi:glycosyltransferase involved in cell wall biosynthesis